MVTELAGRPAFDHGHRFDALEKHLADVADPLIEELRARPDRAEVESAVTRAADHVAMRMTSVHEDMLKRLSTLEETMLALAEALLRPRHEGRD
jgi:hypothetical protein